MKSVWECRCLICDHIWQEEDVHQDPCPKCGEVDDIHSEYIDKITTAEEAAKLMVENNPEYAIEHVAKRLEEDPKNLQTWLDWFNKEGEFPS